MKSLFVKIFAFVWLSHLLALVLIYVTLTATRPNFAPGERPRFDRGARMGRPPGAGPPGGALRRDPTRPRAVPPAKFEIVRFLGILLATSAVAYGLARYLTDPTLKLRRATQQLAAGDLSTRVASQMGNRRDELADLGRDFDIMAARIESLLHSERRLLGDISHELRSPLARLQVALDLAAQTSDEETRFYLERIERESTRLNELIGQLLTLTRLENSALQTPREKVDLAQLVSEIAADADFEARALGRRVLVTRADECCIDGSPELLRRAIENVARNAIHYTPENNTVELALEAHGEHCSIRVRDHGEGVPEEALAKIFDPFYRVADARDRQSGGVGLGLSITARAAAFHGGSVRAQNADGGGLIVEIELPLA